MKSQEEFVAQHEQFWSEFKKVLTNLEMGGQHSSSTQVNEFPKMYRKICHHLDIARTRQYGAHLIKMLNDLVLEGHQYFYESRSKQALKLVQIFTNDFPVAVRKNKKWFWFATALFYGPFFLLMFLVMNKPDVIYSLMSPGQVQMMEEMYDPDSRVNSDERSFGVDISQFGLYIRHNTGIGMTLFGSSLVLGIGTFFVVIFNGVYLGAIFGHLTASGMSSTLYPFVVGHGSFEFTAIVIAGMSGLKVGFAFLVPGKYSRLEAVKVIAHECIPLIYGFIAMFFIAAFIEAFWSPSTYIDSSVKYLVGAFLWLTVFVYLTFVGRRESA